MPSRKRGTRHPSKQQETPNRRGAPVHLRTANPRKGFETHLDNPPAIEEQAGDLAGAVAGSSQSAVNGRSKFRRE
jgi:hypothetical protein